jgi:hypothetical protein
MKILLAALICQLVVCSDLASAQQTEINGAVAYTETMQFDYRKDGIRNRVQFWLEFKGSPALGKPGEAGYNPESGAIYYYLVDMDNKKQVDNWLMGFSMMEGPPPSGPYPMNNIDIKGNMATFAAFGMTWTVIDGGDGYSKDTVTIDDGFSTKDMKLHGGDLRIVSTETEVFVEHLDDLKPCMKCHEPHSGKMAEDACNQCHKTHTIAGISYGYNVPSQHCSACHREAADVLASSRSKHSDIACALCHQEKHKATATCQDCHGAPHPSHVMKKIGICAACHRTAHDLESGRAK